MSRDDAPKRKRGSARMKEFGYLKVEVWLDRTELAAVNDRRQGEREFEPLASLLRRLACEWAGVHFHLR